MSNTGEVRLVIHRTSVAGHDISAVLVVPKPSDAQASDAACCEAETHGTHWHSWNHHGD